MEAAWTSDKLVYYYVTTWCHKKEDLDWKHYCRESFKSSFTFMFSFSVADIQ
jgi:hypothetical protein